MYLLNFLIIIPITAMAYSDFRARSIRVIWFGAFALAILCYGISTQSAYLENTIANAIIMGIIAAFATFYLALRNRRLVNPLHGYIGTGDLLFILCLIPLWEARVLLTFLILSFVSGIVWWLAVRVISGRSRTIPLVGIMGIVFLFYHVYEIFRNAGIR